MLVGANGAGKTTLLRTVATTVRPDAGTIEVCGHDVVADDVAARTCTGVLLGDERAWFWRLSGRQNLEFFAALYGKKRKDARRVTTALLDQVGLGGDADRPFGTYSAGMKLRLGLARALVGDPKLLLLDEPTRSLDPKASIEFRPMVRSLAAEGAAVLVVTHDLHEAAAIADTMYLLEAGRLRPGPPAPYTAAGLEAALTTTA